MIVWMRRNASALKAQLQGEVAGALASGSTWALVAMAFLAVLREGLETAVFLLAAFQDATDPAAAGAGAVLGLLVAAAIGLGLYRGGLRLNLARFFRVTGGVLVVVAAGLVAASLHSAAEAGWIAGGQSEALDLSWLIVPGTVTASLLTGMLGLQPHPTVIEASGWLLYAAPMLVFVVAPDRLRPQARAASAGLAVVAAPVLLLVGVIAGGGAGAAGVPGAAARAVSVRASAAGCEPAVLRLPSGPASFTVASTGGTEYEILDGGRILAEAENLAARIRGRFSLTLQPGTHTLRCAGGRDGRLIVSGARRAVSAPAAVAA